MSGILPKDSLVGDRVRSLMRMELTSISQILITGLNGFIASHTADQLLALGALVCIYVFRP
jgi:hypothetical protein